MNNNIQDQTLIDKCIGLDMLSWRELVDNYINLVYRSASNTIGKNSFHINNQDVEDICQTVFFNLFTNECKTLKRYDGNKASFSTWLTIVTRNITIDFLRKKKSLTVTIDDAIETVHCHRSVEPVKIDIPDSVVTPRQHLVLRMMYDDGLDVTEVAFFLGVKRQTVRSLHHRALKKLREHYGVQKTRRPSLKTVNIND